jgi:membrane-bound metal-dependent hydrolase YbcI (DUF457 family)
LFLGHFAMGLAASRAEPRLRLGTAFLAAQLPDAIWPYLLLAGVERVVIAPGDTAVTPLRFEHYPWSHSLVMVVLWGLAAAGIALALGRTIRVALLLAALVVSHWALDAASHRPDMPLWPDGPVVGLGLWNSVPLTLAVELALFGLAVWLYARGRRLGRSFWLMAATLLLVYVANVFGPPPPSVTAIGASGVVAVPLLWWWGNRAGADAT